MKKQIIILLTFIFLATPVLFGQKSKEKVEFTLHLRDGNIISGTSDDIKTVTLNTQYGTLKVPIKNVNSIEFGLTAKEETKKQVKNLLSQIYSGDEDMQKAAYEELIQLNIDAIPAIENYISSEEFKEGEDPATLFSAESVLSFLKANHGLEDIYKTSDEVTIDMDYKMGGLYDIEAIEVKTEYGKLTVPKMKIKKLMFYFMISAEVKKRFN